MKKKARALMTVAILLTVMIIRPLMVFAACPIESTTSEQASLEADQYYSMLPDALRSQFEQDGWSITISSVTAVNLMSAMFGGSASGGYVAGFTEPFSRIIILSDTDAGSAINHEIGHYFDYAQGYPSKSDLFTDIFRNESKLLDGGDNSYAQSGAEEYFAEAFREYVECAGYLKKNCPRTYSFIDGHMLSYGGTSTNGVTDYARCNSHILSTIAKATADAAAIAAREAAQSIIDSGAAAIGKDAPDIKGWLDKTQGVIDAINQDPEGYAHKKSGEWKEYLENIDWEKRKQETREKAQSRADEINKKLQDDKYWEQQGKDAADKINNKISEWGQKAEEFDGEQAAEDLKKKSSVSLVISDQ